MLECKYDGNLSCTECEEYETCNLYIEDNRKLCRIQIDMGKFYCKRNDKFALPEYDCESCGCEIYKAFIEFWEMEEPDWVNKVKRNKFPKSI